MSDSDRRRHPRIPAPPVPAVLSAEKVLLLDLGDTGARVETRQWMAPGRTYVLSLDHPPFRITGRVVHARLRRLVHGDSGLHPVFEAGFDFAAAPPEARQQLAALMARLAALQPGEQLPLLRVEAG
jgi:hypothetical protein